jgi:hypothetical protein
MPKTVSDMQTNVGNLVGDTSATFLVKIRTFLNNRYRDAIMRFGATMWSYASLGEVSGAAYFPIDIADVLELGACADAWDVKRQFSKAAKYEQKYEWALANRIIAGDYNMFLTSFYRYAAHI